MCLLKYIERLKRMDNLIYKKATGTPEEFSEKLGISKSMLMIHLKELKTLGASVEYNSFRKTYFYSEGCRLKVEFEMSDESN